MPLPFLGPIAAIALRSPRTAAFIARWWKVGLAALLVVAAGIAFTQWQGDVKRDAYNRGFAAAETQFKAKVDAANLRAAKNQVALNLFVQNLGARGDQRETTLQLTLKPQIERITREIISSPIYNDCRLTDSVFVDLNGGRATVDSSIVASNPKPAR